MALIQTTCQHGRHICPTCREMSSWPTETATLDAEGNVIEAAGRLRDALHAGRLTDKAVLDVATAMNRLDELFAHVGTAES